MQDEMTINERRKYVKLMSARYRTAKRKERSQLLSEMEQVTKMHRKSLTRLLNGQSLERKKPTKCATRCRFQAKWLWTAFVAFMVAILRRNFYNIASKQAMWPRLLMNLFRTMLLACCNLVAQPVGVCIPKAARLLPQRANAEWQTLLEKGRYPQYDEGRELTDDPVQRVKRKPFF